MEDLTKYKKILDLFINNIPKNITIVTAQGPKLAIPVVSPQDVIDICSKAVNIFKNEHSLLEINGHCIIVGDIHGHLLDLYYILQKFGLPPRQDYLFLGDLVDRGEFGIETVIIVFLLKIIWPRNVHLIRGNHEFFYQCSQGGFVDHLLY